MLISGSSSIAASLGATALSRLDRLMAPKDAGPAADGVSAAPAKTAKDEFLAYQKMTPAEKMRAAMLAKLGVTEEQLKAMSPEDRKKIEDQMKDMIKEQVMGGDKDKEKTGVLLDLKA
jgi:predicted phage-related endonuclease